MAGGLAGRFQIGEQGANPFPAYAGTGLFGVGETELAGSLAGEQLLLASGLGEIGQIPRCLRGQRGRFSGELAERHHGACLYFVKLDVSAAKVPGVCFSKPG